MLPIHESTSAAGASERRVAELLEELTRQIQTGQEAAVEQILACHPEHADEIRRYLPALRSLAEFDASTLGPAGSTPGLPEGGRGLLGDFRLLREVGRGGMGVVYEAEQLSLGRRVALKVLPFAAMLDERRLQRFKNEAHAAAVLHHPHIVPVYGVGCERGVHYYAMQLIDGCSLAEALAERVVGSAVRTNSDLPLPPGEGRGEGPGEELSPAEGQDSSRSADLSPTPTAAPDRSAQRTLPTDTVAAAAGSTLRDPANRNRFRHIAELGIQAATALAYAHGQGVIHRDIKPSNLLIDRAGKLWVTDFGLARLQADGHELTLTGDVLGTLRYMSPEQLSGEAIVDERTDVYSLGLTLYELLAGRPAFGETARERLVRQILHEDPPPLRKHEASIPRDLETIVSKALCKERDGRYPSARALADDLQRFVVGQPVRARPVGWPRAALRRAQRSPVVAGLGAALVVVLALAALGGAVLSARLASVAGQEAAARRDLDRRLYVADLGRVQAALAAGDLNLAQEILDRHRPEPGQSDRRGFEWDYLAAQSRPGNGAIALDNGLPVYSLSFSPQGDLLASGDWWGSLNVWDTRTHARVRAMSREGMAIRSVDFAPDGRVVAAMNDGWIRVWDPATGLEAATHEFAGKSCGGLTVSPDGSLLAVCVSERSATFSSPSPAIVEVLELEGFSAVARLEGFRAFVRRTAFSPDGKWLAAAGCDGRLRVWSVDGWVEQPLEARIEDGVFALAFSPNGRLLAAGGGLLDATSVFHSGEVRVWNTSDWTPRLRQVVHEGAVNEIVFLDEGREFVTAGGDHRLQLWDVDRGPVPGSLLAHANEVYAAALSPDRRWLATGSEDNKVKLWPVADLRSLLERRSVYAEHNRGCLDACYADGGRLLCSADVEGTVHVLDSATLRLVDKLPGQIAGTVRLAAPRSGPLLAVASGPWPSTGPGRIAVYDLSTRKPRWAGSLEAGFVTGVAMAPDGRELAVGDGESLSVWNATDGRRRMFVSEVTGTANGLAYNASGTRLACVTNTGRLHIVDAQSGQVRNSVACDPGYLYGVAFSPSGLHVATGGSDGYVRLWDVETLAPLGAYRGHSDAVLAISFAPDGRRFASAGKDYRLNLWTPEIDEPLLTLKGHRGWVFQAVFSPGGGQLASVSTDGQLRLWDAAPGDPTIR